MYEFHEYKFRDGHETRVLFESKHYDVLKWLSRMFGGGVWIEDDFVFADSSKKLALGFLMEKSGA